MILILGAMIFAHTLALTKLPSYVAETLLVLDVSPLVLVFGIIAVFIIMGCVLDVMGLMVLFIPLFFPTIIGLGFDPIWFGTMSVLLTQVAMITPPIATSIYVAQALDPEATAMDVTRGIVPFYACTVVLLVLLVFFPQIATWLPSMMA